MSWSLICSSLFSSPSLPYQAIILIPILKPSEGVPEHTPLYIQSYTL